MAVITFEELERELKPKSVHNIKHKSFNAVKIDSKTIEKGDIFIALIGKKHDAHKFIDEAFKNGAYLAIVQKNVKHPHILTDNTFEALKTVAGYILKKSQATSIAVTGSTGKTTTKDLICSMLAKRKCHKTKENENNFIGVSKTLLSIGKNSVCVVETGTNHLGEMKEIAEFFKPDIAVFTNIGNSHLEHFGSLKNIAKEKLSILSDNTYPVFNYDNIYLREAINNKGLSCSLINPQADVYIKSVQNSTITVSCGKKEMTILPPEDVNMYNVLLALAACFAYDNNISEEEINDGLKNFKPQHLRMQKEKLKDTLFILDCYNANPDSVKYAVSSLATKQGKKLAVLGDMLELGDLSEALHRKIGHFIADFDMDLIAFGKDAYYIYEEAKKTNNNTDFFKNKDSLIEFLKSRFTQYDVILLKGSRGMQMENIFYALKGE